MLSNFKGDDVSKNEKPASGYDKRSWAARTGFLGLEVAKRIVSDTRLELLSMASLGVLMMLHARFVQDMPTSASAKHASRVFGISNKAWKAVMDELTNVSPPLVSIVDGNLVPDAIGQTVTPELSKKRSAAAKKAWDTPRKVRSATLTLLPGAQAAADATAQQQAPVAAPVVAPTVEEPQVIQAAEPASAPKSVPDSTAERAPEEKRGFTKSPIAARKPSKKQAAAHSQEAGQPQQLGLLGIDEVPTAEPAKPKKAPLEQLVELYHQHCPALNKLRPIDTWTEKRKKEVESRYRENPDLSWEEFFKLVQGSDFLCGRTVSDRNWKANFDWIMNASNFMRILEGNYNGNGRGPTLFNQGGAKTAADYKDTVVDENDDFMRVAAERAERERLARESQARENKDNGPGGPQ